ncbi:MULTISPECIES: M28 family metallopeptidase [Atribacter]|jgi:hypothetical protein|uniref:Peptidase M28 domain-containing protein n=1 Tax=Atribacter laminatus TaxID=2847778 RepID=A0A7T1AMK5_ATRLM|nr:M28 family peptidase [Atribacter laminatus]QPM68649.1 hypothetical protein RT761_01871 [Atribacter laminatus]
MDINPDSQTGAINITLQFLKNLGARPACSVKEKSCARWIKKQLLSFGFEVIEDEFPSLTTYTWPYLLIWIGLILSVILMKISAPSALVLSVFLTIVEYFEMNSFPVLTTLFKRKKSVNIIGKKSQKPQIILFSHIDSATPSIFFDPRFISDPHLSVQLTIFSSIAICCLALLNLIFSWNFLYILSWIPAAYLILLSVGHIHREFFMEPSPGGNDNGSGVTICLEVARRLANENIPFWVVFTGSEESGTNGAIAFEKKYRSVIGESLILNSDNCGAGHLVAASKEGMWSVFHSDRRLIEQVKEVSHNLSISIDIRPYLGLSTDATPFLARGYRALTFIALNKKGLPVNWHWKTDTIDAVEPDNLLSTSNLICSLLHNSSR